MDRENVSLIINPIIEDFGNMLIEAVMENSDDFPYTCACVRFMSDLKEKGILFDFNSFDSVVVDKVYRELLSFLAQ